VNYIKLAVATGVVSSFLWYVPHYLQQNLSGNKPTVPYNEYTKKSNRDSVFDNELKALYEKTKDEPENIENLKLLANAIAKKLNSAPASSQSLAFELIDTFQKILKISPDDTETLLSMGNISYNYQIFDKAAHYFEKYLEQVKMDHQTRATYASCLSFLGKFDEAEKELIYVISKEPTNFLARANLAINFAIAGDKEAAKKAVDEALPYAPNSDAKVKFKEFLSKLEKDASGETQKTDNVSENLVAPENKKLTIDDYIKSNPIAGPKFIRSHSNGDVLELHFINFPMKQMPPFAKEKFFNGIKEALLNEKQINGDQKSPYKTIKFLDHASGDIMDTLSLNSE